MGWHRHAAATGRPRTIGRPRARLLRALGPHDPPPQITLRGETCRRVDIFKHDSWAATALYHGPSGKVVCKFNRQEPILGLPMAWLGEYLAAHEAAVLRRLGDLPNIPRWSGPVSVDDRVLHNACAHEFIEGHPLGKGERVGESFFVKLEALIRTMHAREVAYVDLHKRENILVGDDGQPHLVDFQVSFLLPADWRAAALRPILHMMQEADLYHLSKHRREHPTRAGSPPQNQEMPRPWFIRWHRSFAEPLRNLRRRLLVALGIRTGLGRAESEHFAEDAVRRQRAAA